MIALVFLMGFVCGVALMTAAVATYRILYFGYED